MRRVYGAFRRKTVAGKLEREEEGRSSREKKIRTRRKCTDMLGVRELE